MDQLTEIYVAIKDPNYIVAFLLDKFKAQIVYYYFAFSKSGLSITKELKDLVEISQEHIEKYEKCNSIEKDNLVLTQ